MSLRDHLMNICMLRVHTSSLRFTLPIYKEQFSSLRLFTVCLVGVWVWGSNSNRNTITTTITNQRQMQIQWNGGRETTEQSGGTETNAQSPKYQHHQKLSHFSGIGWSYQDHDHGPNLHNRHYLNCYCYRYVNGLIFTLTRVEMAEEGSDPQEPSGILFNHSFHYYVRPNKCKLPILFNKWYRVNSITTGKSPLTDCS